MYLEKYGFKDDRMFVARRPGEFLETLINIKKQSKQSIVVIINNIKLVLVT